MRDHHTCKMPRVVSNAKVYVDTVLILYVKCRMCYTTVNHHPSLLNYNLIRIDCVDNGVFLVLNAGKIVQGKKTLRNRKYDIIGMKYPIHN